MNDLYLTLRSVTPGQKGRDALQKAGIRCSLLRAPREIAPGGCAYALALREQDRSRAQMVLDRSGVRWVSCYRRRADGSFVRTDP